MYRSNSIETASIGIQTETEKWDNQTDSQLTASLWSVNFAMAEFEQQNKILLLELNSSKAVLRCTNRSRANAKTNADCKESKLEVSEKRTSDLL